MTADRLPPLRLPGGGFGLVALDQRQSLRDMLGGPCAPATAEEVVDFKIAATAALAPYVPAILLDRRYGLDSAHVPVSMLPAGCSLVLAADLFDQPAGSPVGSSTLDPAVTPELIMASNAWALKLYVLWRRSDATGERNRTVGRFLRLCREVEVPGIVEGVVRPDRADWSSSQERDLAIVDAAVEFGRHRPDLYKAEVPDHGRDAVLVTQYSAAVTSALDCPWVVLLTGVPPDAFGDAVAAACKGGAAGFLAGRAVWSGATTASDRDAALRRDSVERLRELVAWVPADTGCSEEASTCASAQFHDRAGSQSVVTEP